MPQTLELPSTDLDDALRAVAVNSSHNASRALSKWFKRGVRLHADGFVQKPLDEAAHAAGSAESVLAAVHMPLTGCVEGDILLAMPEEVALELADILTGQPKGSGKSFGELERSCTQETANIVGTSFANSLAQWLDIEVVPAAPTFLHDMACAIVEPLLVQAAAVGDAAWMANTEFELDERRLEWAMLLLMTPQTVDVLRERCRADSVRQHALHAVAVNAAFHASQAMSKWLKKGVRLTTEGFVRIPLREIHTQCNPDEPVVMLHMDLENQLHGHILLVLRRDTATELVRRLMPERGDAASELDEMACSCLQETANIVATAFANSVAKWLDLQTQPSTPELRIDMPEAAFGAVLADQAAVSDEVLLSKAVFRLDGQWLDCDLYIVPTPQSFRMIETFCR
ncbi:MAG: hypothetical protein U1D55_14190 [Phycisphaerae bacterium]